METIDRLVKWIEDLVATTAAILKAYFIRIFMVVSRLFNVVLGGLSDETLSCRAFRLGTVSTFWALALIAIDFIFQVWEPQHCETSYEQQKANKED